VIQNTVNNQEIPLCTIIFFRSDYQQEKCARVSYSHKHFFSFSRDITVICTPQVFRLVFSFREHVGVTTTTNSRQQINIMRILLNTTAQTCEVS